MSIGVANQKTIQRKASRKNGRSRGKVMSGGEIFVQALLDEGVEVVFGYPGGVVLGVYDVLYRSPKLRHVLIRHEQGGTHAADGYARATGKPGVVLVTSGPGATNTVTGIATAYMDSIPLVIFTGQVPSAMIGNDAFQEADILGITRPITKHSYLVRDVNELADVIRQAFYIARSGRPGPVLVDLPKDMLTATGMYTPRPKEIRIRGYNPNTDGNLPQIARAAAMISQAKRPVIYAGGGVILGEAARELTELALKAQIPVTTTLMGLGGFPESHPLSLGMLGMHGTWYANMAMTECDLLIAVGARFDDRVTGRLDSFSTKSKKIHIDIDPACISKNVEVDIPIVGDVKRVLPQLTELVEPPDTEEWLATIERWKREHPLRWRQKGEHIMPQWLVQKISEATQGEAIVTADVGQHQMWVAQYYCFNHPRSMINSGGLGTMGYGFPAAVGAAIGRPDREVWCIAGDGGFQMTMVELGTAVQHRVPVKVAIFNNGYLGMVRQWQELFYGGRYSHSYLGDGNPDFVKIAESYGAVGLRATRPEEVEPVLHQAREVKDLPVVIDFHIAREENVYPMIPAGKAIFEMIEE
jgi:acetolactate synthase-1/2/3 large subunit